VQLDEFDAALFEAEQALAQYHRSEAFGVGCRPQRIDVVEILELCRDKIEGALNGSEDDPSVDNGTDEDDEGGEGFLPPSEWTPD
jgi:hypothetical protein